jgi:pimeloyl-ACP methyl ester carboxylesterase
LISDFEQFPYLYEPKISNSLQNYFQMTQNFFEFEGSKTYWEKTGTGKPLLILHGWGSSSAVMRPLADSLSHIRSCYLVDLPGFGQSPEPPEAWTVSRYTDLIEAFIRQIIPDEKTDLLVHSFGARIALKLLTRPQIAGKTDKVIFTGAAGLKPKRKPSFYLKKYTAKFLKAPFLLLPQGLREKGLNRLRSTPIWKKLGSSDYRQLSGVMRETFVKSVSEYLDSYLPKINHEILLVWGVDDLSTPLDQAGRFEKGLRNSALVTIKQAGHYAFLDQPGQFRAIALAYLEPGSQVN